MLGYTVKIAETTLSSFITESEAYRLLSNIRVANETAHHKVPAYIRISTATVEISPPHTIAIHSNLLTQTSGQITNASISF